MDVNDNDSAYLSAYDHPRNSIRSICKERTAVLMVATWKSGETGRRGNRLHVTLSERFCEWSRGANEVLFRSVFMEPSPFPRSSEQEV